MISYRSKRGAPLGQRQRGAALVVVILFTFLAVGTAALFLGRTHVEVNDSRQKAAAVRGLFHVHAALGRAHAVIADAVDPDSEAYVTSAALNQNAALAQPESAGGVDYVANTNRQVRVRTVKPSPNFDALGNELPPTDEAGNPQAYEGLPFGWFVLEARVFEPLATRADGTPLGALKLVRQYVRDGTPLSNNFVAVIDDDLGLGGSPVNPGKPAEGEIHTNKHLYLMTPNPYYANRLLAVDGMSHTAGSTAENSVLLHPDNNFDAEPLVLPLPDSLTSNPDDPDDTLKAYALGANPQPVSLTTGNPDYTVTMSGISSVSELKVSGSHPTPTVQVNFDAAGVPRGLCVEGNVDSRVTIDGDTMTVKLTKPGASSKSLTISGLPTPRDGVAFFDTFLDVGGSARRTQLSGEVSTRTTLATTGNVDLKGSVRYVDDDGDPATKLVYADDLEGVPQSEYGTVPPIPDGVQIPASAEVSYFANKRPPGVGAEDGDGFYDGDAVLGVVAAEDVILMSSMPENAEIAGAYLSLQKRLTLEGVGYSSSGSINYIDGNNGFYKNNGGRSSIRRFGSLVSYKRPATTIVTSTGAFYYGFKRGFSLFDEDMKQKPPPFFPKDKKPLFLGWELKDLGVKPIE